VKHGVTPPALAHRISPTTRTARHAMRTDVVPVRAPAPNKRSTPTHGDAAPAATYPDHTAIGDENLPGDSHRDDQRGEIIRLGEANRALDATPCTGIEQTGSAIQTQPSLTP
jgi:hypothetical protein